MCKSWMSKRADVSCLEPHPLALALTVKWKQFNSILHTRIPDWLASNISQTDRMFWGFCFFLLWRYILTAFDKSDIALQCHSPSRRLVEFAHIHSWIQAGFPTLCWPASPLLLWHSVTDLSRRFALQWHEPGPGRLQWGVFSECCHGVHGVSVDHNIV